MNEKSWDAGPPGPYRTSGLTPEGRVSVTPDQVAEIERTAVPAEIFIAEHFREFEEQILKGAN